MFDLLTVVFRDELDILRVQAQSIDLYCQNIGIQSIFVIVNDDDKIADQIDPAWWGTLSNYVTVVKRSSFNADFDNNGWLSQQVLKILGSLVSKNAYTVVLDAKTIFLQELNLNNVFDYNDRLCVGTLPVFDVFKPAQNIVNNFFKINLTHTIGPAGVPFYFNNTVLKSMVKHIEQETGASFASWFQDQGMVTEFILYSGFLLYTICDLNKVINDLYYQVENVCHSEVGIFDIKLQRMKCNNTLTASIHRNAWSQLTIDQKQQFVDLLVSRNITVAQDLL